ncbi:metalloregulator ArsR/SmtB family transcription factor [Marinomonas sp. C2222]|uniref:Metalloregulator ArsR/SmtB family transcription factor n=1 Tax=Marinomonas sargassi TaxID=2984494 RepID=A0ABT2YSX1_9GAMM|nr:metalloregulator ArsR/SmtB family transcription factor [Marinomonas sargassi]MCV2402984.1 metalloregulator ArsR/SmtB family transcription factor [Marinomonas sargassi]
MNPTIFFKALADETRLRCLLLITHSDELCVCELMAALEEAQPKVSRHLAQLRKSGLLVDRRQGQWVYYRLHPDLPSWANTTLQETLEAQISWLEQNLTQLERMKNRPDRLTACN